MFAAFHNQSPLTTMIDTYQWHIFLLTPAFTDLPGKHQEFKFKSFVVSSGLCKEWRPAPWREDRQIVCFDVKPGQIFTERYWARYQVKWENTLCLMEFSFELMCMSHFSKCFNRHFRQKDRVEMTLPLLGFQAPWGRDWAEKTATAAVSGWTKWHWQNNQR